MDSYGGAQIGGNTQSATNVKGSRINTDIERVLDLTRRINGARDRTLRHTSTLGYFSDNPPAEAGAKVSPISNTLQSAINDLDRAVDGLTSALSLFE